MLDRLRSLALLRITMDFDGSVQSTSRHAEGTAVGFNKKKKGARSYYPLFCTIPQLAQVFDVLHRPGNVHDSHGAKALILQCIERVRQPDAGAAAMGVLAAYLFWRWLRKPSWESSLAASAGLGLALLSKNTWIIMPPLWLAWWLVQRFAPVSGSLFARQRNESPQAHRVKKVPEPRVSEVAKDAQPPLSQLTVIFLLAWYLLNLGYLFEGTFVPLGDYGFISEVLGGPSDAPESFISDPRNRFAGTWVGRVPVPLPYN